MPKRMIKLLNSPDYTTYQEQIRNQNNLNLRSLSAACIIAATGSLLLQLLPTKTIGFAGYGTYYLGISSLAFYLLSLLILPHAPRLILSAGYTYVSLVLLLFTLMGTVWDPASHAVTFMVFLVVMPLFLVDRPWRISLLLMGNTLLFCVITTMVKAPSIARTDIANAVSFCLMGMVLNILFMRIKLSDVVSRRQLEILSITDALTQLLNRCAGEGRITKLVEQRQLQLEPSAVMILDVDCFKKINDTYGHDAGDEVLRRVAQLLRDNLRTDDIVYRMGGDEFAVFLAGVGDRDNALKIGAKLVEKSAQMDTGVGASISFSIGIAMYPEEGTTFQQLYKKADEALYRAKTLGRSRCC